MQHGIRQFARRILAVHLALLAVLLTLVGLAARQIYHSARAQALEQARDRQTLLASQTARAIGNFYEAILIDMDLAKPSEQESGDPDPATKPADDQTADLFDAQPASGAIKAQTPRGPQRPPPGQGRPFAAPGNPPLRPVRGRAAGQLFIARALEGRSHLFWVDRRPQLSAHSVTGDPRAPASPFEAQVLERMGPWLAQVKKPSVSGFLKLPTEARGLNLVASPMIPRDPRSRLLVAAVGVRPVEHEFLEQLNQHNSVDAWLFDDAMTMMAAPQTELVGTTLDPQADPQFRAAWASLKVNGFRGTRELNRPFAVGGAQSLPAMITTEPIQVLDKPWVLMVSSPLAEVDAVVKELSRKAFLWAAFVSIAMAAILVSTAAQLIRSQMRVERVRHQLLQTELKEARRIQLAWLPDKTRRQSRGLEIASINRPAGHISGDFYNFFDLPDGRTAVVIGDVTGHGISAAFLMATAQLLVRTTLPRVLDPGKCLEEVNQLLCTQVFSGQFVTMQVLTIDVTSGTVEIGNAGHPPPLIGTEAGMHRLTLEPQLVLGIDPTEHFASQRIHLSPGDSLLLYTDGIIEAENPAGDHLGLDGLLKKLPGPRAGSQATVDAVLSAVNAFRQSRELKDDLTIVAVQFQPQDAGSTAPLAGASA
jgi:serine phosphatase RsbU (regulator of sigma subunit)